MTANEYWFVTRWRVAGTCGEVADILGNPRELAGWWPSVYLDVRELEPPDARGVGGRVAVLTKGWLPYTIRWEFRVVDSHYPHAFTIDASGDFAGRGVWTIEPDGSSVAISYDWRVRAQKPLLRRLSFLLKPLFAANHRWAMAQGEASLRLELARRRATSHEARVAIPPPPGPVMYSGIALLGGAALAGACLAYLVVRAAGMKRATRSSLPAHPASPAHPARIPPASPSALRVPVPSRNE
jgi:hypothetical protein